MGSKSNLEENLSSSKNNVLFSFDLLSNLFQSILYPINFILTLLLCYIFYKLLFKNKNKAITNEFKKINTTPLVKQDMTLNDLKKYDGKIDNKICLAINRKVFDVSKGYKFYGENGPYCNLAGKDATRALANFDIKAVQDEWDDYNGIDMSQVQEWENQINDQYEFVGNLVKEHTETEDNEDKNVTKTE